VISDEEEEYMVIPLQRGDPLAGRFPGNMP